MSYALIDVAGRVRQIFNWDGETPLTLPDGYTHREELPGDEIWEPRFQADASLAECRLTLHTEISKKRQQLERLGLSYLFPDGLTSTIQTRNDTDIRNIQGNTTAATVLQLQGVADAVLTFRTEDNVNHALTPSQAIAMGMAVAARVQALYAFKWAHDEAIELLETVEDCEAYDTTVGWGEGPIP